MSLFRNIEVQFQDSQNLDAAGRQRGSSPKSLIDLKHTKDKLPLFFDEIVNGTATSNHDATNACVTMSVSANNDYVIRQTKQRFNYQSGNSHLIEMTFSNLLTVTNTLKRVGYFSSTTVAPYNSSLDGIFLESENGIVYACIFKSGTQILRIAQSSWNVDKLDGTGISGITVDWAKGQIFAIDFLWLGLGRVRFSLNIDGIIVTFHEHFTANVNTDVYMTSPNQPIRYEVRSTGGTTSFKMICSTVKSEGDTVTLGYNSSINTGTTLTNFALVNTTYAALGARLKSTHLDISVDLISLGFLGTSNDDYRWEIRLNPTITGTFTYAAKTNSALEEAIGTGLATVTGGFVMASGYVRQTTSNYLTISSALKLGSSINGTQDTLVLCLTPISAGLTVYSSLNFNEKI